MPQPHHIRPTPGRVVWFRPLSSLSAYPDFFYVPREDQPCAAIIVYVWNDRLVDLTVFDHRGVPHRRMSVKLLQAGDPAPHGEVYCEWMPDQLYQAKKKAASCAVWEGALPGGPSLVTDG